MRPFALTVLLAFLVLGASRGARALCPTSPGNREAVLHSPTPEDGGRFGCSLSLSGPRLAVGAEGEGRVHVFLRAGDVWSLEQTLEAPPTEPAGSALGRAVDLLGDRLVATMTRPEDPATGEPRAPAVMVYERGGGGWSLAGVIEAGGDAGGPSLDFGRSLDLHLHRLAIGAPGGSDPAGLAPGWVEVFEHDGSSFVPHGRVESPPGWTNPWTFGGEVALRFPYLVVASGQLPTRVPGEEPVATFRRGLFAWEFDTFLPHFIGSDPGTSLDFDSPWLAVGASGSTPSADLFRPSSSGWEPLFSLSNFISGASGLASVATTEEVALLASTTALADEPIVEVYEIHSSGGAGSSLDGHLSPGAGIERRGDTLPVDLEGLRAVLGTPAALDRGRVDIWACPQNEDPSCAALAAEPSACTAIELEAQADDPDGDALELTWTSPDCPELLFEPSASESLVVARLEGACARSCRVRLEVSDGRGGECASELELRFGDDRAPDWVDPPADESVGCEDVPPVAVVSAVDDCDPLPVLSFEERRVDGACPGEHELLRTWTASDRCGNSRSHEQRIQVSDLDPPVLTAPPDRSVACPAPAAGPDSEAAWLSLASAEDACGGATVHSREISRTAGCGETHEALHEFWAVDACGNESARVQRVHRVVDVTAPTLAAPSDLSVECPAPESGPGSLSAWLAGASAVDECGDAEVLTELVARRPGCGATWEEEWEFRARDECGNESVPVRRRYAVVDTTPPVFESEGEGPLFLRSLWPPDHSYVSFELGALVTASDACGDVSLAVGDCASNQPEDSHAERGGDGRTDRDCVVSLDRERFAVRRERLGACGPDSPRRYEIEVTATDACGNVSRRRGELVVRHDSRLGPAPVTRPSPADRPPFEAVHETLYGEGCGE